MGRGFRRSFKIAPGVRINVSKRGVSTSVGVKGFTVNSRGRVALVPVIVLCVGLYKKSQYKKRLALSNDAVGKANANLDQLIEHELTPRTSFLTGT